MSYGFDTDFDATKYVPEKLRDDELYPKLVDMINYIVQNAAEEFKDIRLKYSGPDQVNQDVIEEVITELGFKYISDVMGTVTNYQFNSLLEFVSVLNLLKGSRLGLEIVLKLLGLNSVVNEWWEQFPRGQPHTYDLTVIMDNNLVPDVNATLERVKIFSEAYVYPKIDNIDFRYGFQFAKKTVVFIGFHKSYHKIRIMKRA